MPERVSYKRLLRKFLAIGPYLREEQCKEGEYHFDCLSVCANAKPAPDKREFWGWWLTLRQQDRSFTYQCHFGFYDADAAWSKKAVPKKHQEELERTLAQFLTRLQQQLTELECQLQPEPATQVELTETTA